MPYLTGPVSKSTACSEAENRGLRNAPISRCLNPEGIRTCWLGCGSSGGRGTRGSSSSSRGSELRDGEEKQDVTNASDPEGGQPHCCSTPKPGPRAVNDGLSPDERS